MSTQSSDSLNVTLGNVVIGSGSTDFDELENRPKYNGTEMTHTTNIPEVKTSTWDAKAETSDIPTKTSQLTNDSGFLTSHQSLSAYRTSSDQDVIDTNLSNSIAAKYTKPGTGVPKTDLASDVQESLTKADTALQTHQSLAAYRTSADQDVIDAGKQSTISDLETIRSGAALGATALQTVPDTYRTSAAQDVIDATKAGVDDIPTKTSDLTNDSGFITDAKAFVATYGTTTAAEVAAALTAGKAVVCEYTQGYIHCQMLLETESDSKYTFTEAGVSTYNGVTSVYGYGAALNKITNEWELASGNGTIFTTAEQITYDSTLETHEAGSVGAALSSQSSQIGTLGNNKEAKGKMTIGSTEYSVTRKALVITDGSTTTTYYVADITA